MIFRARISMIDLFTLISYIAVCFMMQLWNNFHQSWMLKSQCNPFFQSISSEGNNHMKMISIVTDTSLSMSLYLEWWVNESCKQMFKFFQSHTEVSQPLVTLHRRRFPLGHRGKLEYMLVCGTLPSGGLCCMWFSRGKDRAQCVVVFTAPRLTPQFSNEQRWWNTDLRQMIKTHGSTMGLRA